MLLGISLNGLSQQKMITVKGQILHLDTFEPISAKIFYHDLLTNEVLGTSISDPHDGYFQLFLPNGHHYGIGMTTQGFFPIFTELNFVSSIDHSEIERNIYAVPIKKGKVIPLANVSFTEYPEVVAPKSYMALNFLAKVMEIYPNMEIQIRGADHFARVGHTAEDIFDATITLKNYLKKQGIDRDRISCKVVKTISEPLHHGSQQLFKFGFLIKRM